MSCGASLVLGTLLGRELLEVAPVQFPFHGKGLHADVRDRSRGDAVQGRVAAAGDYPLSDLRVELPARWRFDDDDLFAYVHHNVGVHRCRAPGRFVQGIVEGCPVLEVRRPRSVGGVRSGPW